MKKNDSKLKSIISLCKENIRVVIYIIISISSIAIDIFIFTDIYFNHLENLVATCFSALTSIAGIWVTWYLLIFELFRDKYQYNILSKNISSYMKKNFHIVIYNIVFGVIVMTLDKE